MGHDHFYERSWPVVNENITTRGLNGEGLMFVSGFSPIHIVAGVGGKDSYDYAEEQPIGLSIERLHMEYYILQLITLLKQCMLNMLELTTP